MIVTTEHVWEVFSTPLRQFIRKRVPDDESAEDILQEVFLKIHIHIADLRQREKLQSWVYQVTRNTIADYYRTLRPTSPLDLPELLTEELPEESAEAALASSMTAMLECLPEADRQALLLTDYHGMKQRELAERLGLSFSGAKSRVQRARKKLKQALLDCCHFEFDRLGHMIDYQPRCRCCAQQICEPDGQ
jgi:RNA polymerase sigma-70 factor (ECF subfamily)